ncbi:MAG TPA: LysR family transcriptional regulator [Lamprocystis sp. (in: g-proteobacteria)]|nr:LysR family transcriptional regulator [Lamprocystis sp. (in: g-proteobacteria)]
MIKLQQLAHALALWRDGTFHRAAKAQHLSQPAFSRSIRALEESLGVPLFDRQGAAVTPTHYGEALLIRAAAIVGQTQELEREIELLQGLEAGHFAVAVGAYAGELSANHAMGEIIQRHPNLRCMVKLSSWRRVVELVRERAVDLGVAEVSTLGTVADLVAEPVGRHALVLYCRRGHPLLARPALSKADLDAFPLASIRIPPRAASLFPGKGDLDPDTGDLIPSVEVYELTTARALILASDAFGAAAPVQIEPWLRSGELAVLPYRPPWLTLDYGFIYLRNRTLTPAALRFMAVVREIEIDLGRRNRALIDEFYPVDKTAPVATD